MNILQDLLELLTPGSVHQHAGPDKSKLTSTDEFKLIAKTAPDFAKKLEVAWDGDSRDYARNPDKFDPLFPKMLEPKSVEKFAPNFKGHDGMLKLLQQLHAYSFPAKKEAPKTVPSNDVWGHVRWARESIELTLEYDLLREQVEEVLSERC